MERTLVILKPEVLEQHLVGSILKFYDYNDINIIAMTLLKPTKEQMTQHYSDLVGRYSQTLIEEILERMIRGNSIFIVFEGINIIKRIRSINGATDPSKAEEGSIRKTFAKSIDYNLVHGSDSVESSKREISIWFPHL